ncbi:MAG: flippase [Nitrospiraceae bacterium]|nr:flippase [Nitrospiraceae bacterium]
MDIRKAEIGQPSPGARSLTSGILLAKNTAYNLLGSLLPILAAFLAVPSIVRQLGTERFGVLSLAWMVMGYFGFFDMGVGRATTKLVAEHMALGAAELIPKLVWTAVIMLAGLGLFAGLALAALSPFLVQGFLKMPDNLRPETLKAFFLLSASLPFTLGMAAVRGVLEAGQRFGIVNAVKIPASISTYVIPLLVIPFSRSIYPIAAALAASRAIVFFVYFYFLLRLNPDIRRISLPDATHIKKLLGFGGWLAVSNVIGPLMSYMDRFIVGAVLTMSAVAYYTAPYDLVTKLWFISGSLLGVMFPAFSASLAADRGRFALLYERAAKYIMMALAPAVLALVIMARQLLSFWLGKDFALHGAPVLQILAIGVFINSVAQVPYASLQAMGRPDVTAKFHLIELPLYLGMLWGFLLMFGVTGAALAWLIRVIVDAALLYGCAGKMLPETAGKKSLLAQPVLIGVMLLSVYVQGRMCGFFDRFLYLVCVYSVIYALLWRFLLDGDEKKTISDFVRASARGFEA